MKTAFVFPGQGSQSVGMFSAYAKRAEIEKAIRIASEVLGEDYASLIENGPTEQLAQTIHTQPILLTMGVGVFRELKSKHASLNISAMAGHSLGEYSALVAANAMTFEDALTVVRRRAELMQSAVPAGTGAMAAVLGLDDAQVDAVCTPLAREGHWVQAANYNSPGQVVIAGHVEAIHAAIEALKAAGAKRAVILPVSVPSHTELMRTAAQGLADALKHISIQSPEIPVWQNATLRASEDPEAIRTGLVEQLYSPVRWTALIQQLAQQGIKHLVECGPGKVLWGLNRRAVDGLTHTSLHDAAALDAWALESIPSL